VRDTAKYSWARLSRETSVEPVLYMAISVRSRNNTLKASLSDNTVSFNNVWSMSGDPAVE